MLGGNGARLDDLFIPCVCFLGPVNAMLRFLEADLVSAPGVGKNCVEWNFPADKLGKLQVVRSGLGQAHFGCLDENGQGLVRSGIGSPAGSEAELVCRRAAGKVSLGTLRAYRVGNGNLVCNKILQTNER